MISIIVAMGENREIGGGGKIPWHLPADLAHFKQLTTGHTIIMGRKTYESIGRPLPNRRNIIITHQPDYHAEGCEVVGSLEAALAAAGDGEVFVIGGGEIYREALPLASRIYLTQVHHRFDGDVYFPEFDMAVWRQTEDIPGVQDEKNQYPYDFLMFEKAQ